VGDQKYDVTDFGATCGYKIGQSGTIVWTGVRSGQGYDTHTTTLAADTLHEVLRLAYVGDQREAAKAGRSASPSPAPTPNAAPKSTTRAKPKRQAEPKAGAPKGSTSANEEVVSILERTTPHLVPLWRRVQRKIKGSDGPSRLGAFLRYVHENPAEVNQEHDRALWRKINEQNRKERPARATAPAKSGAPSAKPTEKPKAKRAAKAKETAPASPRTKHKAEPKAKSPAKRRAASPSAGPLTQRTPVAPPSAKAHAPATPPSVKDKTVLDALRKKFREEDPSAAETNFTAFKRIWLSGGREATVEWMSLHTFPSVVDAFIDWTNKHFETAQALLEKAPHSAPKSAKKVA
jgi:hypothetical protein